jgi:sugar phosphate isomerase/epimerase
MELLKTSVFGSFPLNQLPEGVMLNLGCHAVLFGERIKTETAYVLENLAKTGFDGVEVGYRFFGDNVAELARELKKQGLLLAGFHVGVKFAAFLNEPDKTGGFLLNIAERILEIPEAVMPRRNIVMSSSFEGFEGGAFEGNPRGLEEAAERLGGIAAGLRERGVIVNYHNHAAEFSGGALVYRMLREKAPLMNFGFDLGWVEAGGGDVKAVLKENPGRVQYVHLRDLASTGGRDFADLGQGVSDLSGIIAAVKENAGDGWLVAEYETGEQDFGRYKRAREYLRAAGL